MSGIRSNEKGIVGSINRLAAKINGLSDSVSAFPGKKPEILAMIVYAVAHFVMAIFHEPWYDEAVAWQIARCASVRDILFEIPHYEGHPPLWHLILLPFAKLGAPYELSLSLISFIFAGAAVYLIIFKSPFPRIIRLLLPFTYFFFYQYGVISRPYCVMMLAFMLLAMNYHSRNDKPARYTLCLMLLCLTSAYGIVIAGGLAIVWVWEIWRFRNIFSFIKTFRKDKRIWWLASLLVLALLLIAQIIPREDTFAINLLSNHKDTNSFWLRLLYMLFCSIPDVSFTSLYVSHNLLQLVEFELSSLLPVCFVGLLFWIGVILYGNRRGTLTILIIPFVIYAIFASAVYYNLHHTGIVLLFIVFWLWVSFALDDSEPVFSLDQFDEHILNSSLVLFSTIIMVISLSWSFFSCVIDIGMVYAIGRSEAAYIKEHSLDQYHIMVAWDTRKDTDSDETIVDINHSSFADNVAAYFDHNIFFNYNNGRDDLCYSTHKCLSESETLERISEWSKITPDVLLMKPDLYSVYSDRISLFEYRRVYSKTYSLIWKGITNTGYSEIYVRSSLADNLGLEEVEMDYPLLIDLIDYFR